MVNMQNVENGRPLPVVTTAEALTIMPRDKRGEKEDGTAAAVVNNKQGLSMNNLFIIVSTISCSSPVSTIRLLALDWLICSKNPAF